MHIRRRRKKIAQGDSLGNLWKSRRIKDIGRQGLSARFLLAAVIDTDKIVRKCEGCQYFAQQIHVPAQELQTIPITWSYAVWDLNMVSPLQRAPGGFTHLFITIDKFTEWIEAKPVATII